MANAFLDPTGHFARQRAFHRLEKLDDEVVNLIAELDAKGCVVGPFVARYLALDPHDEPGYKALRNDLKNTKVMR